MKDIPKYILKLLDKREKLAEKLQDVNYEISDYCERIGMDLINSDLLDTACLLSHVEIYCNPSSAKEATTRAIWEKLNGY